jgi:hypothetical protein
MQARNLLCIVSAVSCAVTSRFEAGKTRFQVTSGSNARERRDAARDVLASFSVVQSERYSTRPAQNTAQLVATDDQVSYAVGVRMRTACPLPNGKS